MTGTAPSTNIIGSPGHGLLGATFGFFIGFAAVSLFGPTAAAFKQALGLSPLEVSWLVAVPALSGSLLRIPFSAWVDTTGGKRPFLVLLMMSGLGMTGLLFSVRAIESLRGAGGAYYLLLALGALVGCGIAVFSVGIGQVSYWFPHKGQGAALGTYAGVGNLAPGVLSFVLPCVLGSLGLADTYLAWLIFLILGTAAYARLAVNAPYFQLRSRGFSDDEAQTIAGTQHGQELFPKGSVVDGLKRSARVWKTWTLVAVYFSTFGGFIALTVWLPTYWSSFHKRPGTTAGALTALYSLLASLIRVPGGNVADRLGGERTAMVSLSVMTTGAVVVALSSSFEVAVVGEVLMALGMGVANACVFKLVPQEVPDAVGGAAGWVGGLGALGGFAIPPMMGAFVQARGRDGYSSGFWVFVALGAMSLAIMLVLVLLRWREPGAARGKHCE